MTEELSTLPNKPAGQEAFRLGQGPGGGLDVHVIENDGGRLAAEFQRAAGDPLAADRRDPPPGRRRAGEGDLVHARIADQQLSDLTVGGDHVEYARQQADGLGRLGDQVNVLASAANALKVRSAPMPPPRAMACSTPDSRGQIWPTSSVRFFSSAPIARR
jgi:hypothetical protein